MANKYLIRFPHDYNRRETVECDEIQQRGESTLFLNHSAVEVNPDGTPKATLIRLVNFREILDVQLVEDDHKPDLTQN